MLEGDGQCFEELLSAKDTNTSHENSDQEADIESDKVEAGRQDLGEGQLTTGSPKHKRREKVEY